MENKETQKRHILPRKKRETLRFGVQIPRTLLDKYDYEFISEFIRKIIKNSLHYLENKKIDTNDTAN